jgi:hypothetical protein
MIAPELLKVGLCRVLAMQGRLLGRNERFAQGARIVLPPAVPTQLGLELHNHCAGSPPREHHKVRGMFSLRDILLSCYA